MHLIEAYASATRLKISKPEILTTFYPLPFDRYCTLQTNGGMSGKNYDYFNEVVSILAPIFKKQNIEIVHLGSKEDAILPNTYRLCGATNLHQSAYIISKALVHFGVDSSMLHFASGFGIPIVGIYAVSPPETCGPFWGDKSKQVCLTPEFEDNYTYSFNPNEDKRWINSIKPETIANSVLTLLNSAERAPLETLYIGKAYRNPIIELVPNDLIGPDQLPNQNINIRADIVFNEQNIYNQVSLRKCVIVTDRALNIQILKQLKQNIVQVIVKLTDIDLFDFIKELHKSSINYNLVTYLDDEKLKDLKLKYLDFNQIVPLVQGKKEDIKKEISENTCFATNKLLLSTGKAYSSRAHYEAKIEASQDNRVIDSPLFWEELEYYYLFSKI